MRIGVNCFLLEPHIGGLRQYFVTLFRELLAGDDGNEYVFFWFRHNAAELEQLGTDRWQKHAVRLDAQRQILDHLDRFDCYFCPLSVLYPRPVPRPAVMTLGDIQEVFYPQFFAPAERYLRELHYPTSTRMADRVITISEFSRRTMIEHLRLAPTRVKAIHLCGDERYARAESARRPDVPLPERYLLYPANWWKHKNHALLFQALGHLRRARGRRFDLVLTGFGQDADSPVRAAAAEHGVEDQVHGLGYRPLEELAYLYRHADMLVFPSLFEGFGMPLVEAMASGCPVVAARDTSIPEVVGDAAELFDPASATELADAIVRVADDPAWRQTLRARGRARARRFSAADLAQGHREAFEEAVRAYSPSALAWRRWFGYWHRARLELRWRAHYGRTLLQCLKASRGWMRDPAR
jgi:glycosyltransferase involved in cell wall biosynthesis